MLDVLIDTLIDALKTLPFLFGAYLIIEFIEHRAAEKFAAWLSKFGRAGSIIGALLGVVPQCGFSVAAANLYSNRMITAGTLIAVFISTSDEAIPVLLANPQSVGKILPLVGAKLVLAAVAGLVGLIPNCAASVVLSQLYAEGAISFGSAVAGLSAGAGVGLLVLFRTNLDKSECIRIAVILFAISVLTGTVLQFILG